MGQFWFLGVTQWRRGITALLCLESAIVTGEYLQWKCFACRDEKIFPRPVNKKDCFLPLNILRIQLAVINITSEYFSRTIIGDAQEDCHLSSAGSSPRAGDMRQISSAGSSPRGCDLRFSNDLLYDVSDLPCSIRGILEMPAWESLLWVWKLRFKATRGLQFDDLKKKSYL